jgi:hypothetical protein
MESRPPQPWEQLQAALLAAGNRKQVISELKIWLDKDPLNPVQVEVTEDQVNRLGLPTARTQ